MAFKDKYTTSVHGRRLGLQAMTTPETGAEAKYDFLVGAEDIRVDHSTSESTSTNLKPFGVSVLTTAVSSGVYTIDPPIPGVTKKLIFSTTGANPIYLKTEGGEFIKSTQGTTMSVLVSSQTNYAAVLMLAESTAAWVLLGSVSSGYVRTSTST